MNAYYRIERWMFLNIWRRTLASDIHSRWLPMQRNIHLSFQFSSRTSIDNNNCYPEINNHFWFQWICGQAGKNGWFIIYPCDQRPEAVIFENYLSYICFNSRLLLIVMIILSRCSCMCVAWALSRLK